MFNVNEAVKDREGYIDPNIFLDEDLYRQELNKIFRKTWLYVGHESSIPKPGSYILNYMGEDEVIVIRDRNSRLRVFLNRCPHRGNKLCLFDRGTQNGFTCSFHGWSFDTEGRLRGVADSEAYADTLHPEKLGLKEVPRVSSYGGLILQAGTTKSHPWMTISEIYAGISIVCSSRTFSAASRYCRAAENT